jgi:hypothetical protein
MESQAPPTRPTKLRPLFRWGIMLGAFLLALFAAIVVLEELVSGKLGESFGTAVINILTALAAIGGAFGYAFRRRWGIPAFGLSVLGHFIAHTILILTAIAADRVNVFAIGGLSFIPVVSLMVFIGMWWESGGWGRP